MSDTGVAAVEGFTGPGRRVSLVAGNVEEITFKLKKKVIEITNNRGEMGSYDLAQVNSIQVASDGQEFTIAVMSKEEAEVEENVRSKAASDAKRTGPETTRDSKFGSTTGKNPVPAGSGTTAGTTKS